MISGFREHQRDEGACRYPHQDREQADGQSDEAEHRAEGSIGSFLVVLFQMTAQDRDQGDGEVGPGQEVVEEVGNGERLAIEIALNVDPDQGGEKRLTGQPEEAGQQDAAGDDRGRSPHFQRAAHATPAWGRSSSTT